MTEFAQGSVWFEVEVLLSSDSGRPKHTDVVEQGFWLLDAFKRALTSLPLEGAGFGRIRYWGANAHGDGPLLREEDVGGYLKPFHEEQLDGLKDLIRTLVIELDPSTVPDGLVEVVEWARGERDGTDLTVERRRLLWDPTDPSHDG